MKRYIKVMLLSVTLLIGLTGCLSLTGETKKDGSSADNLDDEVIISQVKEQLKKNMDQIGFEVNVDDYTYRVYPKGQTGSTSGTVTMTNKEYSIYGSIRVYSGSLGSKRKNETIEFKKVEVNPVIFIAQAYADYTIKNIFNNTTLGNDVNSILLETKGTIVNPQVNYEYPSAAVTGDGARSIEEYDKNISETRFLNTQITMQNDTYLSFFKGNSSENFDYEEFMSTMKLYTVLGIYVDTTDQNINELQEKIKKYYNVNTLVVIVTNYKRS